MVVVDDVGADLAIRALDQLFDLLVTSDPRCKRATGVGSFKS
jgi:hypothetical protein